MLSRTPGEKTGAAVTNVRTYVGSYPLSGAGVFVEIRGEATAVEVEPGKYLFALIGEETKNLALRAWGPGIPARDTDDKSRVIEHKRESITLTPDLYPMLVTFGNLRDPASVKEVDPSNLAASFGPGYALKSITLEITDETVTEGGVEALLPWIGDPKVMNNPGWQEIPIDARRRLQGLITDYTGAQKRFLEGDK